MDFSYLLTLAESNKSVAKEELKVKRYSTDISAAKKAPKNGVNSSAIQHFLKKKELEERKKALNDIKRREDLLQMRSAAKHNRKASAMAKRTKDNNFAARFDEPPPEKPERNEPRSDERNEPRSNERNEPRSNVSETPQASSKPRKRRPKEDGGKSLGKSSPDIYHKTSSNPSSNGYSVDSSRDRDLQNKVPKQKPRPPPPPSYHDLLQLAKAKQHEPVVIQKVEKKEERLMTQEEKMRNKEEETRKKFQSSNPLGGSGKAAEKKKASSSSILRDELTRNNENISDKKVQSPKDQNKINSSNASLQNRNIPQNHPSKIVNSDSKHTKKPIATIQPVKTQDLKVRTSGNPLHSKSASVNMSSSKPNVSKQPISKEMMAARKDIKTSEDKMRTKVSSSQQVPPNAIKKDAQKSSVSKQLPPKPVSNKDGFSKQTSINNPSKQNVVKGAKPGPSADSSSVGGGPPRPLPSKNGPPPRPLPSKNGPPPRPLPSKNGPPPRPLPSKNGPSRPFPPRDASSRPFPYRDGPSRPFPYRDGPSNFPPRDMMRPRMPVKRRIESDDEDFDEEMDDFIDDTPIPEEEDYSSAIREIFKYDRRKYVFDDDDDDNMETNFAQQMKEEAYSAKMGRLEDLEDMRLEQEEMKRKKTNMKKTNMMI